MAERTEQVDAYLNNLDPTRRAALERVRALVFETVPDIQETMRYRMPTFELNDVVFAVASQKHYMSLYLDPALVEKHKGELQGLDCGKSCVRFKRIEDLPLDTIRKIIEEMVESSKAG
jgi:uncharacterized protein YdhG (YjbR/CyaY superfamily)